MKWNVAIRGCPTLYFRTFASRTACGGRAVLHNRYMPARGKATAAAGATKRAFFAIYVVEGRE